MAKGKRRSEKVERRQKRVASKREERAAATARREEEEAEDEAEDRAALEPLAPLLAERGPLAGMRFDLAALPEDRRGRGEDGGALASWFVQALGDLASPEWRERARAALGALRSELEAARVEEHHPDLHAVKQALFWLEEALATGAPALENRLLWFLFEQTCAAEALAGRLPAWAGRAMGLTATEARRDLLDHRRERAGQRLALGPFQDDLLLDDMPGAAPMISISALAPGEFAARTADAADRDLTPERRARVAERLRESAGRAEAEGRALYAFDLRTLAAALESRGPSGEERDPLDQGLARLYYARSVFRRREDATASEAEWPAP